MKRRNENDRLHYISQGDGPPALLIHGIAASCYDWESLLPELAGAGYRAYALDLPGHGESPKPDDVKFYLASAIYAELHAWIERQSFGQSLLLIGHSLGGYLALQYALDHQQDVRALVLIDPFYNLQQVTPILRRLSRRPEIGERVLSTVPEWLINAVMGLDPASVSRFSGTARQQIAADFKRASPHILHIPASTRDLTSELHRIYPPALVLWGEKDLTLSPPSFQKLVSLLPNARGCSLDGCGHQPHIGKPEVVNRLVLEFLAEMQVDRPAA
jgi:pimeloyl-ACP methyl ester carboxylesterase